MFISGEIYDKTGAVKENLNDQRKKTVAELINDINNIMFFIIILFISLLLTAPSLRKVL